MQFRVRTDSKIVGIHTFRKLELLKNEFSTCLRCIETVLRIYTMEFLNNSILSIELALFILEVEESKNLFDLLPDFRAQKKGVFQEQNRFL